MTAGLRGIDGRKTRNFPLPDPGANPIAPGRVVIDGIHGLGFSPEALFIGAKEPGAVDSSAYEPAAVTWWTAEIFGLHRPGAYQRFVTVYGGDQVVVPIEGFDDVRVRVLASSTPGPLAYVIATERCPVNVDLKVGPRFAQVYVAAGTYRVPPGAVRAYPGAADAGFAWQTPYDGGVVSVADPVGPGSDVRVKGVLFTTTLSTFPVIWEIQL